MILDFGAGFTLRQATSADHPALLNVCLKTGDAGKDASGIEDDPELLGLVYAVPYQVLEPDFAFVISGPDTVAGYLFGAPDTRLFNARMAAAWYPGLRSRVGDPGPDPDRWRGSDRTRHAIHHPDLTLPKVLEAYPSHGHIDLLPAARSRGIGRRAVTFLEGRLRAAGSTGLHLQVDARNHDALNFYRAIGYDAIRDPAIPDNFVYVVKPLRA